MNLKKLAVLLLALLLLSWGGQGLSPVYAQESGQKVEVAPPAAQPKIESVKAPAAPKAEEQASMQKIGQTGAKFGKETGKFFTCAGKKTGHFFKDAGVKTGSFFKNLFVKH